MDIIKILSVGIIASVLAFTAGNLKKEFTVPVALIGGAMILLAALPGLSKLTESLENSAAQAGINSSYVNIVFKSAAVACMTSICAAVCRDMGQGGIAAKLELAGRISIVVTALPAINALLELIGQTVN